MQSCGGLSEMAARILAGRGVTPENVSKHVKPRLRDSLEASFFLHDMDKAVARVHKALRDGEKVALLTDYDVDGAASAALLGRYFRAVDKDFALYVPCRLREGYGPSVAAFRKLHSAGARLVLVLDCGMQAFAPLQAAQEMGLETIVFDHHPGTNTLPASFAVVNPRRFDERGGFGDLAAAGVVFLFLIALTRCLDESGFWKSGTRPNLLEWLDLVALATIADVVPLRGLNRVFAAQGLRVMTKRRNPGLAAICACAYLRGSLQAEDISFQIAPRLNSASRLDDSQMLTRILLALPEEATDLARQLEVLNRKRKDLQNRTYPLVLEQVSGQVAGSSILFAVDKRWHFGIVGILAGRLCDLHHRPAFVAVETPEGIMRGSARAPVGWDVGSALRAAEDRGLVLSGGGHAQAAGFRLSAAKLPELRAFLDSFMREPNSSVSKVPDLYVDGMLQLGSCGAELWRSLQICAPFGQGYPPPRFVFPGVRVQHIRLHPAQHIFCSLQGGAAEGDKKIPAVAFGGRVTKKVRECLLHSRTPLHVAGELEDGKRMRILDVAAC